MLLVRQHVIEYSILCGAKSIVANLLNIRDLAVMQIIILKSHPEMPISQLIQCLNGTVCFWIRPDTRDHSRP